MLFSGCWTVILDFSGSLSLYLCCLHLSEVRMVLQVVGDDLLMSNPKRIERAIRESTCNALLLKVLAIHCFHGFFCFLFLSEYVMFEKLAVI